MEKQCQRHMDPVPPMQMSFRAKNNEAKGKQKAVSTPPEVRRGLRAVGGLRQHRDAWHCRASAQLILHCRGSDGKEGACLGLAVLWGSGQESPSGSRGGGRIGLPSKTPGWGAG